MLLTWYCLARGQRSTRLNSCHYECLPHALWLEVMSRPNDGTWTTIEDDLTFHAFEVPYDEPK